MCGNNSGQYNRNKSCGEYCNSNGYRSVATYQGHFCGEHSEQIGNSRSQQKSISCLDNTYDTRIENEQIQRSARRKTFFVFFQNIKRQQENLLDMSRRKTKQ